MNVYCSGECHVWLGSSNLCTCEVAKAGQLIGNYYPHFPPRPPTPPTAGQQPDKAPDVPLHVFKAAQDVNATHLSVDGTTAYDERGNGVWRCFWDEETKAFGGWWWGTGLPADAVRIE
jgi:hypothetical protein